MKGFRGTIACEGDSYFGSIIENAYLDGGTLMIKTEGDDAIEFAARIVSGETYHEFPRQVRHTFEFRELVKSHEESKDDPAWEEVYRGYVVKVGAWFVQPGGNFRYISDPSLARRFTKQEALNFIKGKGIGNISKYRIEDAR